MTDDAIACPHPAGGTVTTVCEGFQKTAAMRPNAVALRRPGGKDEITWREYGERVAELAAGLAALGVGHGDTVGIMLTNRPEFHLVDTAAVHLGAIPFSIYNTSSAEQIEYLFGNAENTVVVTEQAFLPQITAAKSAVKHVVSVDGGEGTMSLDDVAAEGSADFDFEAAWRAVQPGDVATLIYTSGTTGPPKGVEITHSNVCAEVLALQPMVNVGPDDSIVSYLPSAHIADRVVGVYSGNMRGVQVTCVDDPKAIAEALPEARPTVFFGVPRLWQKIKAGIETKLASESGVKQKLALWAVDTGVRAAGKKLRGQNLSPLESAQHAVAEKLVLSKLRHALGMDRVRWAASGAAAIPPAVLEYFHGLGVPVYEVWGMSETTGATTVNKPGAIKVGSVGTTVDQAEVKLGDDGELLVRGPVIMRGYRKMPDKTADTIDEDGWLATGDIAEIDDNGFVTIVDRKKELIINESGKNMSPTNIENTLKAESSLIGQAVAIGDGRPYVGALVVLDPEAAAARGEKLGMSDTSVAAVSERAEIRDEIAAAIKRGNAKLSRAEQVKRFTLVGKEWEPGGPELTPTLKLKRAPIAENYTAEIESLYASEEQPHVVSL